MPCGNGSEYYEQIEASRTLNAACEMAKLLMSLQSVPPVSNETAVWIAEHIKRDERVRQNKIAILEKALRELKNDS